MFTGDTGDGAMPVKSSAEKTEAMPPCAKFVAQSRRPAFTSTATDQPRSAILMAKVSPAMPPPSTRQSVRCSSTAAR